ncbi:MAG: transcription termination factor NusA [Lachnospiraceae bacterium]|nr:transcription termination factor NusA [Lachnospiraceae bacterium]
MATKKTKSNVNSDGKELINALAAIEKEMQIDKDVMLKAVEDSLKNACKSQFGSSENIRVQIDKKTGEIKVFADVTIVEDAEWFDEAKEIGITEAKLKYGPDVEVGTVLTHEVTPKNFGRIAAQNAKQTIVQTIRQQERQVAYDFFKERQHHVITGIVQRYNGNKIQLNLGKLDTTLVEKEQVPTERFRPTDRVKVYVVDVKKTQRDPKVIVSRTHPDLVRGLFEEEVTELQDGSVEIMKIAREAGSRTKIAVYTKIPNIDPVGACVGVNGCRVNAVVEELKGEKIDIIVWSDIPAILIENALSPASVITVDVDVDEKHAEVLVPDDQLSLAIGKEGQNARLAAKLTGYTIDIKSESGLLNF